jgi:hypothetical protein
MKKQTKIRFSNKTILFIGMIKNGLFIALINVKPFKTKRKHVHELENFFFTNGKFASSSLQNPIKNIICSPE